MQKRYWRVGFHLFRSPRPLRSSNFFSPEVASTHLHLLPFAILVPSIHSRIWNKCSYSGYMILKFWNRLPVLFCTYVQCLMPYISFVLKKPGKQSRRKRGFFTLLSFAHRKSVFSGGGNGRLPSSPPRLLIKHAHAILPFFSSFSSRFLPPFSAKPRNGWRKGEEGGGIEGKPWKGEKSFFFPALGHREDGTKGRDSEKAVAKEEEGSPLRTDHESGERGREKGGPGCLAAASSLVGLGLTTVRRSLAGHFIHGAEREKIPRGVLMGPPISRR